MLPFSHHVPRTDLANDVERAETLNYNKIVNSIALSQGVPLSVSLAWQGFTMFRLACSIIEFKTSVLDQYLAQKDVVKCVVDSSQSRFYLL